jgi:hypothetical protein
LWLYGGWWHTAATNGLHRSEVAASVHRSQAGFCYPTLVCNRKETIVTPTPLRSHSICALAGASAQCPSRCYRLPAAARSPPPTAGARLHGRPVVCPDTRSPARLRAFWVQTHLNLRPAAFILTGALAHALGAAAPPHLGRIAGFLAGAAVACWELMGRAQNAGLAPAEHKRAAQDLAALQEAALKVGTCWCWWGRERGGDSQSH